MKHLPAAVAIIGLVLLTLFALDRSCNADRELAQAKSDYAEHVRVLEADNAIKQETILAAEKVITQQDANIAGYVGQISTYHAEISALRAELSSIQDDEPPTTPEIEAMPIVISLRKQVTWLTDMLALSNGIVADQERTIASWQTKYYAQLDVSRSWQAQYENEHALRLESERLFGLAEHKAKSSKFWRYTTYIAGAVALGAIIAK